jgi:hypothetical protein
MQHFWTEFNPYMAEGTLEWTWGVGENEHYWGYSVRPDGFLMDVEVEREWTTTGRHDTFETQHFIVTVRHVTEQRNGGLVRFSALAAIGS